jgi:signal transduction histidine kinase
MQSGLEIIAARADGLARFMQAYARLARLPAPARTPCPLAPLAQRAAVLEPRLPVQILGGPDLTLSCDAAQIEQVLINLIKNAVEAALEQRPAGRGEAGVRIGWKKTAHFVEIAVEDDGPGIANASNLFVPFFTTKPEGSGIGLVLCRQIAENHGGSLALKNRDGATHGCIATLRLPT